MMTDDVLEVRVDGEVLAKCALWWSATPQFEGSRVGFIGHYERSDERAAQTLLQLVRKRLALAGCGIVVGPVDGSTWHRYRFVTERGDRPPFLLEPVSCRSRITYPPRKYRWIAATRAPIARRSACDRPAF
jgi:hypothetical protein